MIQTNGFSFDSGNLTTSLNGTNETNVAFGPRILINSVAITYTPQSSVMRFKLSVHPNYLGTRSKVPEGLYLGAPIFR